MSASGESNYKPNLPIQRLLDLSGIYECRNIRQVLQGFIYFIKNDGKIEKFFKVLSTNMSLKPGTSPHSNVLFFRPSENGHQTPHDGGDLSSEVYSVLQRPPVLESVSPHSSCNIATVFLKSLFLGLLVKIAGYEATLLLIDLEFTGSSLVDTFFFWKETNILIDHVEENYLFYRSFMCMFLFDYAFITVRKNDRSDFEVTYRTFGNPQRFGNPLNGAFPRAVRDPKDDSGTLVELLPFCSPMTLKDATDKSYTFKQLKVYIDPRNSFLVFFFTLVTFDDDEIDGRELDDDSNFEIANSKLSFPNCERSISSPIVFEHQEQGEYIASFTIKIGNEDYNVRLHFGTYKDYYIEHCDRHYTLSAISDRDTCTTIFCGNTDAEVLMKRGMPRVGILKIEITDFVAPKTEDDSAIVAALRHLPVDLQDFLTLITWRNPEAAGSN